MKKLQNYILLAFAIGLLGFIGLIIASAFKIELTPFIRGLGYLFTFLICGSVILSALFPVKK